MGDLDYVYCDLSRPHKVKYDDAWHGAKQSPYMYMIYVFNSDLWPTLAPVRDRPSKFG